MAILTLAGVAAFMLFMNSVAGCLKKLYDAAVPPVSAILRILWELKNNRQPDFKY